MKYSGAKFGTMHNAEALSDRQRIAMNRKICRKAPEKLFTADYAAERMLQVLSELTPEDSGQLFAWDGARIPF